MGERRWSASSAAALGTDRRLVPAAAPGLPGLELSMDVRLYREKPAGRESPKKAAQSLWAFLAAQGTAA